MKPDAIVSTLLGVISVLMGLMIGLVLYVWNDHKAIAKEQSNEIKTLLIELDKDADKTKDNVLLLQVSDMEQSASIKNHEERIGYLEQNTNLNKTSRR